VHRTEKRDLVKKNDTENDSSGKKRKIDRALIWQTDLALVSKKKAGPNRGKRKRREVMVERGRVRGWGIKSGLERRLNEGADEKVSS